MRIPTINHTFFVKVFISLVVVSILGGDASARDPFEVNIDVEGVIGESGFDKAEDALDVFDDDGIRRVVPSYTGVERTEGVLDFRGFPLLVSYPNQNDTTLLFEVPDLGISEQFTGATRNDSQEAFEDFIKSNKDDILRRLMALLVEKTAVDPVAGNPNSLMARMGDASFFTGSDLSGGNRQKHFGLGVRFGRYSAGNFTQDAVTLPLNYTHYFDDTRYRLIFDAPVSFISTGGAKTFLGSFGLAYRFPVTKNWSLTPSGRAGAVGSVDLGSAAIISSGTVTSNYNLHWKDLRFTIANMGGYFKTSSVDAGDFKVGYDLENWITKNGIGVGGLFGVDLLGLPLAWQGNVAHTQFFGDALFIDSYVDIAASIGADDLQIGLTYTTATGEDYDAVKANLGYQF